MHYRFKYDTARLPCIFGGGGGYVCAGKTAYLSANALSFLPLSISSLPHVLTRRRRLLRLLPKDHFVTSAALSHIFLGLSRLLCRATKGCFSLSHAVTVCTSYECVSQSFFNASYNIRLSGKNNGLHDLTMGTLYPVSSVGSFWFG